MGKYGLAFGYVMSGLVKFLRGLEFIWRIARRVSGVVLCFTFLWTVRVRGPCFTVQQDVYSVIGALCFALAGLWTSWEASELLLRPYFPEQG